MVGSATSFFDNGNSFAEEPLSSFSSLTRGSNCPVEAGGGAADRVRGPGRSGARPEAGAGAPRADRPENGGNPTDRATWRRCLVGCDMV